MPLQPLWADLPLDQQKAFVKLSLKYWKPDAEISPFLSPLSRMIWGQLDAAFALTVWGRGVEKASRL